MNLEALNTMTTPSNQPEIPEATPDTLPPAVIFSAPMGWGKTTKAQALAREHGCTLIIEEWSPRCPTVPGALHLTSTQPGILNFLYSGAPVLQGRVKLVLRGWP